MGNPRPPHTETAGELAARSRVRVAAGLSDEEVQTRQQQFGPNLLPSPPSRSKWRIFVSQFSSALILILLGASVLSAAIGNNKDAIVIACVVVVNALFGFYQEYRAERSLAALKSMLSVTARVRRMGVVAEVPAESVVPGDLLLVEAGDRIAADGRFVLSANLEVDESTLTGESAPVAKITDALTDADLAIGDRTNMAYMNTLATRGRGELIVTATAVRTEVGRLSQQLAETAELPSPLQIQLDRLGKRLGTVALTLVGLLSFLELLRGASPTHVIIDGIALAVAAMPEGLPVVVTVTLALGMHQMARRRAIVKRLANVETLGCTTVICSDKTGTLTLNEMTVRAFFLADRFYEVTGEGYRTHGAIRAIQVDQVGSELTPLLAAVVGCNDSRIDRERVVGDPMEAALLVLAAKGGVSRETVDADLPRVAEVPFDSAHKFMATFHAADDHVLMYVKGAPDVLLARCAFEMSAAGPCPLQNPPREKIERAYMEFGARGLRGLLVASRMLPRTAFTSSGDLARHVTDLTFLGLLGIMDPPRPEAMEAIRQCTEAGIAVKMITGDHKSTATAIARELGLEGNTRSGAELDLQDSAELAATLDNVCVFARVAPAHKVRIVRALQSKGHVVAMTGDGVNDAPALKAADIGVAMGITGTAVAKEAATMVLTDDNFATIVSAIHQGRVLYDNILKFVRFQLSTTIGAILTVFFAPLAGLPEPFTPLQILWVAIIMDGPPAISLALDSARPGIMREPPRRRNASVLPLSRLGKIAAYGITMMAGTLSVLYYGLHTASEGQALTLAFTTFVLFQFFNVFNARVENGSAFNSRFFGNRLLWASLAGVIGLQFLAVNWSPAQQLFETTALTAQQWALAAGVASLVLLLEEVRKLLRIPTSRQLPAR
jgi:Ca2+-transporting ATPase